MNKRGFTLVEIIASITLVAVISLLAFSALSNQIKKSQEKIDSATLSIIYSATDLYMDSFSNKYPLIKGNMFCISIQDLADNNNLKDPLTGSNGKEIDKTQIVKVELPNNNDTSFTLVKSGECTEKGLIYKDNSGANIPSLGSKMMPIKYDGTKWVKADTTKEWYDYDKKEWANAVVLKDDATYNTYKNGASGKEIVEADVHSYLVWIPRYKYAVSAGTGAREINVTFEKKTDTLANGTGQGTDYYSHPAFCFGTLTTVNNRTTCDGDEVSGLWIGKFEVNAGFTSKPDITSLRIQTVSQFYNGIQALNSNLGATDTHMMKNMEWGAMAYLTQSKYGRCTSGTCTEVTINANSSYLTGGGNYKTNINQSTTGNVYGIYDTSGGAYEYVMGNLNNTISNAGFTTLPNQKYYDKYTGTTGLKGDATNADGTNGWYSDYAYFVNTADPWFIRGGSYVNGGNAGVFAFSNGNGGTYSDSSSRLFVITH